MSTPGGFAVSSTAYDAVLDQDNLRDRLRQVLEGVDGTNLSTQSITQAKLEKYTTHLKSRFMLLALPAAVPNLSCKPQGLS